MTLVIPPGSWIEARVDVDEALLSPAVLHTAESVLGLSLSGTLSQRFHLLGDHEGVSSANDPVTISPAGSYVPIMTPVVETLLSISFSAAGMVPSENRRWPDPMTSGKIQRRYSSIRLWRSSVWIRFPLPCTCNSGPSSFLSAAMPSTGSPSISSELLHSSVECPR